MQFNAALTDILHSAAAAAFALNVAFSDALFLVLNRTTVEEGGETVFPNAQTKVTGPEWSDCAKQGLAVKTKRGDALLFFR